MSREVKHIAYTTNHGKVGENAKIYYNGSYDWTVVYVGFTPTEYGKPKRYVIAEKNFAHITITSDCSIRKAA